MKKRVYITQRIPKVGMEILKSHKINIAVNLKTKPLTHRELIKNIRNKEGLVCLLGDRIDKKIIDKGSNLKVIATYSVGYDNIDVDYATKRNVMVTNTPGVLTDATAELTWSLIFSCARRIAESDRFIRQDKKWFWRPGLMVGTELVNKTLGIIGAGRIGQAVGLKARGFGMKIIYTDNTRKHDFERKTYAKRKNLKTLLKSSDFVTLHVPLTHKTRYLISKKELSLMKSTSYLINTSRGPVVDEDSLVKALKTNKIAGAGLDVYEKEPKVHPGLLKLDNTVLLPHIGSATRQARDEMAVMVAENIVAVLNNQKPPNLVNKI